MAPIKLFINVGFTILILSLVLQCVKEERERESYRKKVESFDIIAKELMKGQSQ